MARYDEHFFRNGHSADVIVFDDSKPTMDATGFARKSSDILPALPGVLDKSTYELPQNYQHGKFLAERTLRGAGLPGFLPRHYLLALVNEANSHGTSPRAGSSDAN